MHRAPNLELCQQAQGLLVLLLHHRVFHTVDALDLLDNQLGVGVHRDAGRSQAQCFLQAQKQGAVLGFIVGGLTQALAQAGLLMESTRLHLVMLTAIETGDTELADASIVRHLGYTRGAWAAPDPPAATLRPVVRAVPEPQTQEPTGPVDDRPAFGQRVAWPI